MLQIQEFETKKDAKSVYLDTEGEQQLRIEISQAQFNLSKYHNYKFHYSKFTENIVEGHLKKKINTFFHTNKSYLRRYFKLDFK